MLFCFCYFHLVHAMSFLSTLTYILYKTTGFIEGFQLQHVPYILHTADSAR